MPVLSFANRVFSYLRWLPPLKFAKRRQRIRVARPRLWQHLDRIEVGERSVIREHSWLAPLPVWNGTPHSARITIGSNVYIGRFCCISSIDLVFSANKYTSPMRYMRLTRAPDTFFPSRCLAKDRYASGGVHS
jgi:hypothetical protein